MWRREYLLHPLMMLFISRQTNLAWCQEVKEILGRILLFFQQGVGCYCGRRWLAWLGNGLSRPFIRRRLVGESVGLHWVVVGRLPRSAACELYFGPVLAVIEHKFLAKELSGRLELRSRLQYLHHLSLRGYLCCGDSVLRIAHRVVDDPKVGICVAGSRHDPVPIARMTSYSLVRILITTPMYQDLEILY
jgi:hypothetical protein